MSYATIDVSIHDGDVLWLFDFLSGSTHYRYASGDVDVTFDSNAYTAVSMMTSTLGVPQLGGSVREFIVEMPVSLQVVQDHVGIPKDELTVTAIRLHGSDGANYAQQFEGRVAGFDGAPPLISARCVTTLEDPLDEVVPSVHDTRLCSHALYDDRCQVVRTSFDLATTVSGAPSGRSVTVASIGGAADGYYNAGEIVRDSDGARRTIRTQVGAALVIQSPFRTLSDSDAVTLYAGCDHTVQTCMATFNNVANFGGIPTSYPRDFFDVGRLIRSPFGRGSN